jgi:hypothetical protein
MKTQSCRTILLALFLFACHPRQHVAAGSLTGIPDRLASSVRGTYYGHYSKGLITLVINYISGGTASGYDIHKGLRRNLNGEVVQNGGQVSFVLKEPGGNPYDGTFFLSFDTATNKISGRWVPTDSTKAHSGAVSLAGKDTTGANEYLGEFLGDLGRLSFGEEGVCTLEYYPSKGDNSQLITVKGSYEQKGDTLRIDWQRNDRTPVLNMRLIRKAAVNGTDSTSGSPSRLVGDGVEFVENNAG